MIKEYNPNIRRAVHTIRITLMYFDYVGHIAYEMGGNCKGATILNASCFEDDCQENIERYPENDCNLRYDEEMDIFTAVLTNARGEEMEIEMTTEEIQDIVVAIEFSNVEEE